MMKSIPDKLYFKIGEVAKLAEVPTHVIRYWESEFTSIKPKRANSKQRLFRKQDVELILRIKQLLHHEGYTIAGARKLLASGSEPEEAQSATSAVVPNQKAIKQKLEMLKKGLLDLRDYVSPKK